MSALTVQAPQRPRRTSVGPAGALPLFRAHRLHTRKNDISSTVDLYVRPYHTASTQEQSSSASQHLPTNLHTLGTNSVINMKNAYSLTRGSSVCHPRQLGENICLLEVPSHPGPSHVATLADSQCSRQHLPYHRGAVLAPLLLQGVVSHTGTWPHQWSAEVELSPMATRTLGAKPACHRSGTQSQKQAQWPRQHSAEVELSPMATHNLGAKPACHRTPKSYPHQHNAELEESPLATRNLE